MTGKRRKKKLKIKTNMVGSLNFILLGLIFVMLFLQLSQYDYFMSLQCTRNIVGKGECILIRNSLTNKYKETLPISDINEVIIKKYTKCNDSCSDYNDLYLKTSLGEIPLVKKNPDEGKLLNQVIGAQENINDFINKKNRKSLNIVINRKPYFNSVIIVDIVIFTAIALAMFLYFYFSRRKKRSKKELKTQIKP